MPHRDTVAETQRDLPEEVDKWTFALDADGDILWDAAANRPATVDGLNAVKQDLLVALDSYEGEDPLDPDFGLDVFTAVRDTPHLQHEITKTLEYDDYKHNRVDTVRRVAVNYEPPGSRNATVEIDVELEDGEPMQLLFNLFAGSVRVA